MHILFLSHYYPPEVNAPASRLAENAAAWFRAGHRVTVVTGAPNHPGGKVFPGFRNRWFQRETLDGVEVIRLWTFLAANEGFALRLLNYLSFTFSVLANLPRLPRSDVVVSTTPQFFCGLAGWMLKRRNRPWVLEVRDLWPESIVTVGAMKHGAAIRVLERIERLAYRKADALVSVTDSFVPHLLAPRHGKGPLAVIKNGVDLTLFDPAASASAGEAWCAAHDLGGKFVAAYVGTHGMAHGLDTVVAAAQRLRDDPRIAFVLVGDGSERARLARMVEEHKLTNLLILGQRPKSEIPAIWSATDASLVLLKRHDTFKSVLPSKIFEAMACECPIVLGVEGEAEKLVADAGAGIAIVPEDAEQLAAALLRLAADPVLAREMGLSGRRFVQANFDRSVIATRYLRFLADVAQGKAK